jgi:hypothetical protein
MEQNFSLVCPYCSQRLRISTQYAGQRGKCKRCGGEFLVPAIASVTPPPIPSTRKASLAQVSLQSNRSMAQVALLSGLGGICLGGLISPLTILAGHTALGHISKGRYNTTSNRLRAWTGLALGYFAALIFLAMLFSGAFSEPQEHQVTDSTPIVEQAEVPLDHEMPTPTRTNEKRKEATALPQYEILKKENFHDYKLSFDVEIQEPRTNLPNEEQLRALSRKLYADNDGKRYERVFICYYLPGMEVDAGAWATGHHNPDLEIKILFHPNADVKISCDLPEEKRKEFFLALVRAERRAYLEADQRYPSEPTRHLTTQQIFTLSQTTPLMPERNPVDPIAALARMKQLPPGTKIKVIKVSDEHGTPWYQVRASSPEGNTLGRGWINALALAGQSPLDPNSQDAKWWEMHDELTQEYRAKVIKQCGLTEKQIDDIYFEGGEKNWKAY